MDVLIEIIYKTRKNLVKYVIKGELSGLILLFMFIVLIPLNQLDNLFLFYFIETFEVIDPFIFYIPGYKIAKELKQQYPLTDNSSKKDNKKWY